MIKKIARAFLISVVLTAGESSLAQLAQSAPAQPQPPESKNDLPKPASQVAFVAPTTVLKKSVAFITVDCIDGANKVQARGTGFFVFVPDARVGENQGFGYLVTNRHVVEPEESGHKLTVLSRSVRMNLQKEDGDIASQEALLPLNAQWFFPADPSVDLAVLPFAPDQKRFDYTAFPLSMFATKDVITANAVAEGDPVLFAGFFYQYPGQKKIEPIVRQGIIAMMPDEDLKTTLGLPGRVYLGDVHVFGGNSGSPVLVNLGGMRNGGLMLGGFPYKLLGVVSGYYYETEDFRLETAATLAGTANANSGICVIVPAEQLKELLDAPELQVQRNIALASQRPNARR